MLSIYLEVRDFGDEDEIYKSDETSRENMNEFCVFIADQKSGDPYKGKKNETKLVCFNMDLSNLTKVWSTTYQSPSLYTAFLSDRNPWIDTYIHIQTYTLRKFFSLVTTRVKGLHARRN